MEEQLTTMRELLDGFPRPPPGLCRASGGFGGGEEEGILLGQDVCLPMEGVKKILKTLSPYFRMPQVSRKDAQHFSFFRGFEDEESDELRNCSDEASS
ncbi:hypothetical protein HAX54_042301 [Datura stramonium]|uniref:Uncharacterized protein n=1 Tax=Datura stramonium TaxID=4076 RepID=A0ABS8SLU2_DATST|nr:hypothetical protein [Datura stramonium]